MTRDQVVPHNGVHILQRWSRTPAGTAAAAANAEYLRRILGLSDQQRRRIETLTTNNEVLVCIVDPSLSGPPAAGHEALLVRQLGYSRLEATYLARALNHFGRQFAKERNQIEKPLAKAFRRLWRASKQSYFLMWRSAKDLRPFLEDGVSSRVIEKVLVKAHLSLTFEEFRKIVHGAVDRDREACRRLGELSQVMGPYMPDPRGKRVSVGTGIHLMVLYALKQLGRRHAYTWSSAEEDFVDCATKATRVTLGDNDFDPRPAYRLLKSEGF